MSGGSYDYAYQKIQELAEDVRRQSDGAPNAALRRAFAKHLELVARAAHDLEWVDSCDYGTGDEEEAIRACLRKDAELLDAIEIADEARQHLEEVLRRSREAE